MPLPRMPAEWEPHRATWLTWPHCDDTWPGTLEQVIPSFIQMIRALATSEQVYVNVLDDDHRVQVAAALQNKGISTQPSSQVKLIVLPTDDEWIRDYGAYFVKADGTLLATDWMFNSWGEKYDRGETNNTVPEEMSKVVGVDCMKFSMVLEGGAIDVNGIGDCLTTESCLLNPNRNPDLSRDKIEDFLSRSLGINNVIWLGSGIEGDDTDGHVDDLTRFVTPDVVVTAVESDPEDVNFRPLQENLNRLKSAKLLSGKALEVLELPMPSPVHYRGQRLPASYMNFYIANRVVLLPQFGDPTDDEAMSLLAQCFPDRKIVPISAHQLAWGLGACHCLTQQVPQ